jgi:hypothetical protein
MKSMVQLIRSTIVTSVNSWAPHTTLSNLARN